MSEYERHMQIAAAGERIRELYSKHAGRDRLGTYRELIAADLRAIARQVQPPYTPDPPTEPGFYWVRHAPGDDQTTEIVELEQGEFLDEGREWVKGLVAFRLGDECRILLYRLRDAEWSGPLEPPG